MSGFLRFVFIGSFVTILIVGGIYLFAGPTFFQLVSLTKQSDDQYLVVGFAATADLSDLKRDPFDWQTVLFESEEGTLLTDLKFDFEMQGVLTQTEKRLLVYGFPSHEGYLYAITNMSNVLQEEPAHVLESVRFSDYASIAKAVSYTHLTLPTKRIV